MLSHTQRKTGRKGNVIVEREEYQGPDVRRGPSQAAAGHTSLPVRFPHAHSRLKFRLK